MGPVFQVREIYEESKKIFGSCSDPVLFDRISSAVEVLASTGSFDPLEGTVDVCLDGTNILTLPREVHQVLAVNIDGQPGMGRSQLFSFHMNGPGDCNQYQHCRPPIGWRDNGLVPTYRYLKEPSKLVAFVENELDDGSEVWAYGMDRSNNEIKTVNADGSVTRGYQLPTIFGYAVPESDAQIFSRVTGLRRVAGAGTIRISSYDNDFTTGTLLSYMQWDEVNPMYRQIKLERSCPGWARVHYRKEFYKIRSLDDIIPLSSFSALEMMMQAIKLYKEGDIARATGLEATARRWLTESSEVLETPTSDPIQVFDRHNVGSDIDRLD